MWCMRSFRRETSFPTLGCHSGIWFVATTPKYGRIRCCSRKKNQHEERVCGSAQCRPRKYSSHRLNFSLNSSAKIQTKTPKKNEKNKTYDWSKRKLENQGYINHYEKPRRQMSINGQFSCFPLIELEIDMYPKHLISMYPWVCIWVCNRWGLDTAVLLS